MHFMTDWNEFITSQKARALSIVYLVRLRK